MGPSKGAIKMRRWRAANAEKSRETARAWRSANPGKSAEYSRRYRENSPETAKAAQLSWYQRNIDEQRARKVKYRNENLDEARRKSSAYNKANPDKIAAHRRNRVARAKAGGSHTEKDVAEIFVLQKGRCAYCRADLAERKRHVDHIQPLARGGANDRTNLQILCVPCNKTKSAKDPIMFAQSLGMLL